MRVKGYLSHQLSLDCRSNTIYFALCLTVFFSLLGFRLLRSVMSRSSSATSSELDFLGRKPPSASSSSSNESSELDFLGRKPSSASSGSSGAQSQSSEQSEPKQRRQRKQARPKRRRDRVLQQIRKLQNSTNLCIPRLPFQRVVREVLQKFNNEMRVQGQTIEALRESSEMFLVQMFTDAYLAAKHANRVTLQYKDIHFIKHLMPPTVYY